MMIDKDNYIHDMTDEHLREIQLDSKEKPLSVKLAYSILLNDKIVRVYYLYQSNILQRMTRIEEEKAQ